MISIDLPRGARWLEVLKYIIIISLLALRLAVREMGLPLSLILYQNPRLVPRTVY